MTDHTVALVARGNPRDRRTWSGTPLALSIALEARGVKVIAIDASADSRMQRAASAHGLFRYGIKSRVAFSYLGPRKQISQRIVRKASGPRVHTDTMWLYHGNVDNSDCLFRDTDIVDVAEAWNVDQRLIDRLAEEHSKIYSQAGLILTTSQWCANTLISRYSLPSEKIMVVGTGLGGGLGPMAHSSTYANKKSLCVARVRHSQKGIDLLLAAFAEARRQCAELELDIVVPKGSVRAQEGVRIHSDLTGAGLSRLFSEASLYAMPARWEPWGLVYLEALSHGTPILTSPNCAGPELCGNGEFGFVVDDLSVESIARSLIDAHEDPDILKSKGEAGREFCNSMRWDTAAGAIQEWLHALDS